MHSAAICNLSGITGATLKAKTVIANQLPRPKAIIQRRVLRLVIFRLDKGAREISVSIVVFPIQF
jgi:hypothetical protein